jgi:SAM-dependent methyltransferase
VLGGTEEITSGSLQCTCGKDFPIVRGVADFVSEPSEHAAEEIEGNRMIANSDLREFDDEWLVGLPKTRVAQKPDMLVHDEEADLSGLISQIGGRNARVLDLGAGTCWTTVRWAAAGHTVTAADISLEKNVGLFSGEVLIDRFGSFFERVRFDMDSRWPFADRSFDVVSASSSLHHSRDLPSLFMEARRVLRDDGLLVFIDTTRSVLIPERWWEFGVREKEVFHLNERIHSQSAYRSAARHAGFSLSILAAPSFTKKLEMVRDREEVIGRNRIKHKLGRAAQPLLRLPVFWSAVTGPLFPMLNLLVGTQFLAVARAARR